MTQVMITFVGNEGVMPHFSLITLKWWPKSNHHFKVMTITFQQNFRKSSPEKSSRLPFCKGQMVVIKLITTTFVKENGSRDDFLGDDFPKFCWKVMVITLKWWLLFGHHLKVMGEKWGITGSLLPKVIITSVITVKSDHYFSHYRQLLTRWWVLVMITGVMITLRIEVKKSDQPTSA